MAKGPGSTRGGSQHGHRHHMSPEVASSQKKYRHKERQANPEFTQLTAVSRANTQATCVTKKDRHLPSHGQRQPGARNGRHYFLKLLSQTVQQESQSSEHRKNPFVKAPPAGIYLP